MRRLFSCVVYASGFVLVFFGLVDGLLQLAYTVRNSRVKAVALPYVVGHDYGPVPPWLDGLRILEPDDVVVWRGRANMRRTYVDIFSPSRREEDRFQPLRQFLPSLPESLKQNPTWEIALNSEGFRDDEFPQEKDPSSLRVVCLGDSWTFGANVSQSQSYPARLKALLREKYPNQKAEVLNLGVLGYCSYNGLKLLETRLPTLKPDVVVLAFAMNEPTMAGYKPPSGPVASATHRVQAALGQWELYKLLHYAALRLRYQPRPFAEHFQVEARRATFLELISSAPEKLDTWLRDSPLEYESHYRQMIRLARSRGAGVVLLYNEFEAEGIYGRVLQKLSQLEGVPLVDASRLIEKARKKIEDQKERELGLLPAPAAAASAAPPETIFRVYMGDLPVPKSVYIAGDHPELGSLVPNKVAMYDDGTHGDQRAGDGVWSRALPLEPGRRVFYVYTNSGPEGQWEGLDVPHVRRIRIPKDSTSRTFYGPVETFGKVYMQADSWHTNSEGYELISQAVAESIPARP